MSTTVTIHPTTPSGSCPFAELPHELMTEVFLHLDPHTLYTSIRQLNRDWKETVETHIIPMAFKSGKWRLALRIHQRPRKLSPEQQRFAPRVDPNETDEQRRSRVESTLGAWEDELHQQQPDQTTTTYLPLELDKVSPTDDRFEFSTGSNWYAIYELSDRQSDNSFRLDLDFGVAWRFEGDGKDEEEQRPGGWTKLDQENGWLSKFYCSGYDLSNPGVKAGAKQHMGVEETYKLHATPLTRRRRLPSKGGNARQLDWDDSHLEYFNLQLCLGTEFFVRRSARANLLMRALEAEAARREAAAAAPNEELSPPTSRIIHRPLAQKAALAAHSHRHLNATPPPSRSSPPGQQQLRSDMTPAEQLQMLAKSKAAAKAAGGAGSNNKRLPSWARNANSNSKRTVSQPVSRNPSQPSSLAPSRVVSRAPTRPGSPVTDDSEPLEQLSDTPPRMNTSRFNTPAIPGTPVASPRDMPFFRAQALSLSTASPFTHRALSGYTTPNAGSAGTNSFALRGGGGAEPGGTPFAEFKARLRRAKGFAAAPDPDERRRKRAESISSIATLTLGNATNGASSSSSTWNKTQDSKLDGEGVTREWRWAKVCSAKTTQDGTDREESDSPVETEWSWSR